MPKLDTTELLNRNGPRWPAWEHLPQYTETLLLRGPQWKYSSSLNLMVPQIKGICTQSPPPKFLNLFSFLSFPSERVPQNLMGCIAKTTHWTGNWWSRQSGGWRSERGGVRGKEDWVGPRLTGSRLTGRRKCLVYGQVEKEFRCRRPWWSHKVVMAGLFQSRGGGWGMGGMLSWQN